MSGHNPKVAGYHWTDRLEGLLRRYVQSGIPYSQIVYKMPADDAGHFPSRHALIGKMHRDGVKAPARDAPAPKSQPKAKTPAAPKEPPQPRQTVWAHPRGGDGQSLVLRECAPLPRETKVDQEPLRISILDLRHDSCRWPLGDPRDDDFAYCGLKAVENRPYCPQHFKLSYTTAKTRRAAPYIPDRQRSRA